MVLTAVSWYYGTYNKATPGRHDCLYISSEDSEIATSGVLKLEQQAIGGAVNGRDGQPFSTRTES